MSLYFLFISGGELIFVFLAVLLLFGSSKIPELARMFGKGMNEFRKATDDIKREFNDSTGGIVDDIKESQNVINREIRELGDSVTEETNYEPYESNSINSESTRKDSSSSDLEKESDSKPSKD